MFNRNNARYWARENEHRFREGAFQERFGTNVWLGVVGTTIIGPIFFQNHLTAADYLGFLENEIEESLEQLPVDLYHRMFFQQDGAPAHNARVVSDYLNHRFGERWIGTNGPVNWPARSPDLTPLDFFVWDFLKEKVYDRPIRNRNDLEEKVRTAVRMITPEILGNVMREIVERIYECLNQNGGHFEHLNYG